MLSKVFIQNYDFMTAISKAFSVLNDPSQRKRYDISGEEFYHAAERQHFEQQVPPDELFEMLFRQFAMGSFGSPFGEPFRTTFNFRGPEIFVQRENFEGLFRMNHQFGNNRFRRRRTTQDANNNDEYEWEMLKERMRLLFPFLFLLIISIVLSWLGQ